LNQVLSIFSLVFLSSLVFLLSFRYFFYPSLLTPVPWRLTQTSPPPCCPTPHKNVTFRYTAFFFFVRAFCCPSRKNSSPFPSYFPCWSSFLFSDEDRFGNSFEGSVVRPACFGMPGCLFLSYKLDRNTFSSDHFFIPPWIGVFLAYARTQCMPKCFLERFYSGARYSW